ncbi:acyl carrier protein [Bacillus safensis]|nr:acyl carrier protein [Bacillus sp. SDF0016]
MTMNATPYDRFIKTIAFFSFINQNVTYINLLERSRDMNELTLTEVEEKIVQLVMNKLSLNEQPSRDDSLKALGLNSVQIVSFVISLEDTFHIAFEDEELHPDHFRTLDRLFTLVKNKLTKTL